VKTGREFVFIYTGIHAIC